MIQNEPGRRAPILRSTSARRPRHRLKNDRSDRPVRDRGHAGDRDRSRQKPHHSDVDVSRLRLYNCSWRHLGEGHPHSLDVASGHAGTYYQASTHMWRTFDQVMVTGGLLSEKPPLLDESQLFVRTDTGNLTTQGKPTKFEFVNGVASGISDHLPITGRIILS